MRHRSRVALVLVLVLAATVAVLSIVPSPSRSPLGRLGSFEADGPDPSYDAPVDAAAIRRAADLLPRDVTYYVHAPRADPLLQGNLKAAGQLLFTPAVPVQDPAAAEWVLSYRAEPRLPSGLAPAASERVGPGVFLIRVAR
jgi:hypothetical protein